MFCGFGYNGPGVEFALAEFFSSFRLFKLISVTTMQINVIFDLLMTVFDKLLI